MTTDEIPVGIVGCGHVAHRYASALVGAKQTRFRLIACTDTDPDKAGAFAAKFEIPVMPSFAAVLQEGAQLLCICTPNRTHATLAKKCLEAGRNVIVEHPLAMNAQEAEDLCLTATKAAGLLFTMRQRRFLRTIQALHRALQLNLLGTIERVDLSLLLHRRPEYYRESLWRRDRENGGVLLNQASHALDILLYLFGEFIEVAGCLGNVFHNIECEDAAFGKIDFPGSISATFECTTAAQKGRISVELLVSGSRSEVRLGGNALERFVQSPPEEILQLEQSLGPGPEGGDHLGYLDRVEKRLMRKETELVDAVEGSRAVRLFDAIYGSFQRDNAAVRRHFAGRCLDRNGESACHSTLQ